MNAECPSCGAPIEFRYDDSFVRVCPYCRAAVLRGDRGLESLGKVADLVPMESPLRLFAEGHHGSSTFLLVGMAQIRHSAGGLWQEWYAKLDGGVWGWLAEAQGRFYLTFEQPGAELPPQLSFQVGQTVELPVNGTPRTFTVAELGTAKYVAANGELPYRLVPDGSFRYVDLADGQGTFATIDYGDAGDQPALYVGHQVTLDELRITGGEIAPPRDEKIKSIRLACPNCNAAVELRAPGESQRVVCAYCNTLLDNQGGNLAALSKLPQKAQPSIPLGSKGTFVEGEMTVIGFVSRSAYLDATWWPFDEYLLYAPNIGFRWLVQSDGHWSYVQPIAAGAVKDGLIGGVEYENVKFRGFQRAQLRVDQVLGEFYWRVEAGETVEGADFIAPPAMLSREMSGLEQNWSLSTYLTEAEVRHAFGDAQMTFSPPVGVAPNQPDPCKAPSAVLSIAFVALMLIGLVFAMLADNTKKFATEVKIPQGTPAATPVATTATPIGDIAQSCAEYKALMDTLLKCPSLPQEVASGLTSLPTLDGSAWNELPADAKASMAESCASAVSTIRSSAPTYGCDLGTVPAAPSDPVGHIVFSEPFELNGKNIEIEMRAPYLNNNWAYLVVDLVKEDTGAVVTVDGNIEHYSGVEDGESWSEGSYATREVVPPMGKGSYLLRIEGQHGGTGDVLATVIVRQDVFRWSYLGLALLLLGLPLGILGLISWSHEKRRWENSTEGEAPRTPFAILILVLGGVVTGLYYIIKFLLEAASDD